MTWTRLALLIIGALFAFSAQAEDKFAGTWKGEYNGKTYVIVTLKQGGGTLSGTIRLGDINTDKDGEITGVEREADHEYEILDPKIVSGKLRFRSEDTDGSTLQYEMTAVDDTHAGLQLLGSPVPIRPFRLKK